jgi:hypothetical protein
MRRPSEARRGGAVAECDRLRDLHLVADARRELDEPALELRAGVGGEGHGASGTRLDLVVGGEFGAADGRDARVDGVVALFTERGGSLVYRVWVRPPPTLTLQ